jgi:hypothetical protein
MTVIHIRKSPGEKKEWIFGSADPSNETVKLFGSMVHKRFGSLNRWTNRLVGSLEYYLEIKPNEPRPYFMKTVCVSTGKETIIAKNHSLWSTF